MYTRSRYQHPGDIAVAVAPAKQHKRCMLCVCALCVCVCCVCVCVVCVVCVLSLLLCVVTLLTSCFMTGACLNMRAGLPGAICRPSISARVQPLAYTHKHNNKHNTQKHISTTQTEASTKQHNNMETGHTTRIQGRPRHRHRHRHSHVPSPWLTSQNA